MRPHIIFVVAYDLRGGIGYRGALPWHLPADLVQFKAVTIGKPVIMGRKTFASIGKPLKLRRNIVLTRDRSFDADGVETAASVQEVLALTENAGEIAVIGGAQVFEAFAPFVDEIYATQVLTQVDADTFFTLPERAHTRRETGSFEADDRNAYAMRFVRYEFTAPAPSPAVP